VETRIREAIAMAQREGRVEVTVRGRLLPIPASLRGVVEERSRLAAKLGIRRVLAVPVFDEVELSADIAASVAAHTVETALEEVESRCGRASLILPPGRVAAAVAAKLLGRPRAVDIYPAVFARAVERKRGSLEARHVTRVDNYAVVVMAAVRLGGFRRTEKPWAQAWWSGVDGADSESTRRFYESFEEERWNKILGGDVVVGVLTGLVRQGFLVTEVYPNHAYAWDDSSLVATHRGIEEECDVAGSLSAHLIDQLGADLSGPSLEKLHASCLSKDYPPYRVTIGRLREPYFFLREPLAPIDVFLPREGRHRVILALHDLFDHESAGAERQRIAHLYRVIGKYADDLVVTGHTADALEKKVGLRS
jgi:hypothetical protein